MLKEKTMCVGDLVSNREFDVNCNFDIYDCTRPGADWTDGAKRIFSTIENRWVEPPDDSVNLRSPSPVLDERSRCNLRCCVDGVSDSPCTSSDLRTDGQPEVGRGLPSIDDVLQMAIRYITLDFSRHTIVVEAGRAS